MLYLSKCCCFIMCHCNSLSFVYDLNILFYYSGNSSSAGCVMLCFSTNGHMTTTTFIIKVMIYILKTSNRGMTWTSCKFLCLSDIRFLRQSLVTRIDQDFDIRRVQTQAEKFLPKVETLTRSRKRKILSKQKASSVRWVNSCFYLVLPI